LYAGGVVGGGAQRGGELRFAIASDPKTLDPHLVADNVSQTIQYLTGGVLVRLNRLTQKPEPALAWSWQILERGRAIEFHLRENVLFSDGTPFTADDVAYSVRRFLDPALQSPLADIFRPGGGDMTVSVRSKYVVLVRMPAIVPGLAELWDQAPIVSSKSPKKLGASLGSFYIAEYKPGASLMLKRNPNYWRHDALGQPMPYLDSIRLDILANHDMELLRFRRGELHLLDTLDPESFERLATQMKGVARDSGPGLDSEQFWFNQVAAAPIPEYKKAWFRSTAFRQAISEVINRNDLCRLVFHGRAQPAIGPISRANKIWFNAKLTPPVHSPDAAIAGLRKAGFSLNNGTLVGPAGHTVEFSVITNSGNQARERMAALIQQDLLKIGIKLNIVPLDFKSLIERITRTYQYEACLLGLNQDMDANAQIHVWLSSGPSHQWNPSQKTPATPWEAEIDRLMREQASTTDLQRRKAAFDRVQEIVVEQQPFIYLLTKDVLSAVSPRVINANPVALHPRTFWNIDELRISDRL
jgi:peptide/nickel transport system substrate-binding protein